MFNEITALVEAVIAWLSAVGQLPQTAALIKAIDAFLANPPAAAAAAETSPQPSPQNPPSPLQPAARGIPKRIVNP